MKKLFLLLFALLSVVAVSAQTKTVKGQVVFAGDNEPLVGATVVPVGGGSAVATDYNGEFTLVVPQSVNLLQLLTLEWCLSRLMQPLR